MEKYWAVSVYMENGKVIDYATFPTKWEAEFYGRQATGTNYHLNFIVKQIG